jgi:hypothetical protein
MNLRIGDVLSEIWKIVLTSALTIIGGVFIYIAGRFLESFFVQPILQLRLHIGDVANELSYYANIYSNPGVVTNEDGKKATDTLRRLSTQLSSKVICVPWYSFWSFMRLVPTKRNIKLAYKGLINLSNSVNINTSSIDTAKVRKEIEGALGISLFS